MDRKSRARMLLDSPAVVGASISTASPTTRRPTRAVGGAISPSGKGT